MRTLTLSTPAFPPPSILPKTSRKLKLLDIDPLELARQLTLLESDLFFKIRQGECLARAKDSTPDGTDSIKSVIFTSNKVADWVADSILSKDDSRKRAAVIRMFISVADVSDSLFRVPPPRNGTNPCLVEMSIVVQLLDHGGAHCWP